MIFTNSTETNDVNCKHIISIVNSLDEIAEEEFLPLSQGRSFYVSRPWLLAIERLRGRDTAYITSRDRTGNLLGVLPIYWGKPSTRGYYEPYKRFLERSQGEFNEKDWSPSFIIGSRAAYSCEFLLSNDIEQAEQNEVLKAMLEFAEEFRKEWGSASTSVLYMTDSGSMQLKKNITNPAFFLAGAHAVLEIKWKSFDEYLAHLKGRDRVTVRREERVFSSAGYRIESAKLGDSIDVFAELFANHENKYGHKTTPQKEAIELNTLVDTANEYSHVLVLKLGERAVGCILLFLWEKTIYARTVGFDFSLVGQAFEYFNLAYYEVIRFAIENGFRHVDYGMGTYRAKLKRGANLKPLWGYVNSEGHPTPFEDSKFKDWNNERIAAVHLEDATILERIQFP
ncbi:GNAT family N-acetyltransferase [Mesobacillus subterraneus]|uniref:GNAT family N-acetyltransferase n=1 Tax=Mesobacillus subterraneus TaxID=285983 RepID=UPI00203F187F|nr:GNAT family N-acetyltransferase [Mesobacillus subterraneus]MCM3666376.1 GNAT family N-acetyltransferase [Mesobacillus subterraneus]MCM3685352.1 GNAT family N-acetyltransferase [Mesobacillus subterraneus]